MLINLTTLKPLVQKISTPQMNFFGFYVSLNMINNKIFNKQINDEG